jgi:hypothetical protein
MNTLPLAGPNAAGVRGAVVVGALISLFFGTLDRCLAQRRLPTGQKCITITSINQNAPPNNFTVTSKVGAQAITATVFVNPKTTTPATLAAAIVEEFNNKSPNFASIDPNNASNVLVSSPNIGKVPGVAVARGILTTVGVPASRGIRFASLGFGPDPNTLNSVLLTDATITAGFDSGLPQVSFQGHAGETLDQLTVDLQSALEGGGYHALLGQGNQVDVLSYGGSTASGFEFAVDPNDGLSSLGISFSISTVPEPSSLLLVLLGTAATVGYRRFRSFRKAEGF